MLLVDFIYITIVHLRLGVRLEIWIWILHEDVSNNSAFWVGLRVCLFYKDFSIDLDLFFFIYMVSRSYYDQVSIK